MRTHWRRDGGPLLRVNISNKWAFSAHLCLTDWKGAILAEAWASSMNTEYIYSLGNLLGKLKVGFLSDNLNGSIFLKISLINFTLWGIKKKNHKKQTEDHMEAVGGSCDCAFQAVPSTLLYIWALFVWYSHEVAEGLWSQYCACLAHSVRLVYQLKWGWKLVSSSLSL